MARAVAAVTFQTDACFRAAAKARPGLAGEVALGWKVDNGVVRDVHTVRNTTGDDALATCLGNATRNMRYEGWIVTEVKEHAWVAPKAP